MHRVIPVRRKRDETRREETSGRREAKEGRGEEVLSRVGWASIEIQREFRGIRWNTRGIKAANRFGKQGGRRRFWWWSHTKCWSRARIYARERLGLIWRRMLGGEPQEILRANFSPPRCCPDKYILFFYIASNIIFFID